MENKPMNETEKYRNELRKEKKNMKKINTDKNAGIAHSANIAI